jgi:hypothetical protein
MSLKRLKIGYHCILYLHYIKKSLSIWFIKKYMLWRTQYLEK